MARGGGGSGKCGSLTSRPCARLLSEPCPSSPHLDFGNCQHLLRNSCLIQAEALTCRLRCGQTAVPPSRFSSGADCTSIYVLRIASSCPQCSLKATQTLSPVLMRSVNA